MTGVKPGVQETTVEEKDADRHNTPAAPAGEPKPEADGDTIAELGDAVGGPA